MKKMNFFKTALLAIACMAGLGNAGAETVTDILTAANFAATGTTYVNFTGVTSTSNAVYAGNSGKTSTGGIQLRSSKSNSGIVTTTTGGKAKKVTIAWESNTTTGRTLTVLRYETFGRAGCVPINRHRKLMRGSMLE